MPAEYIECVALVASGIGGLNDWFATHLSGIPPRGQFSGLQVSETDFDNIWLASQDDYDAFVDRVHCAVKLFWWWRTDTVFRERLWTYSADYYQGREPERAACMIRRSLDAQEWPVTYLIDAHSPFYRWTDLDRSSPRHTIWRAALGDACRPPSKTSLPEILWRELVSH